MNGSGLLRFVPVILGGLITIGLLLVTWSRPDFSWDGIARVAVVLALGMATVFLLRAALQPPAETKGPSEDGVRNRIAPQVIGLGTVAIIALSLAVMILVRIVEGEEQRTAILSVFTSVLPVFATWVGTVLAFYFSNESFRQAAESSRALIGGAAVPEPINGQTRMIPYGKITKLVLGKEGVPANAAAVPMVMVRGLFGPTITRVIVFTADERPVYIVRQKLDIPDDTQLIGDYLAREGHLADATNFRYLTTQATVEDGRRLLKLYNTLDIFLTDRGTAEEPVRGWVTDDRLA